MLLIIVFITETEGKLQQMSITFSVLLLISKIDERNRGNEIENIQSILYHLPVLGKYYPYIYQGVFLSCVGYFIKLHRKQGWCNATCKCALHCVRE